MKTLFFEIGLLMFNGLTVNEQRTQHFYRPFFLVEAPIVEKYDLKLYFENSMLAGKAIKTASQMSLETRGHGLSYGVGISTENFMEHKNAGAGETYFVKVSYKFGDRN